MAWSAVLSACAREGAAGAPVDIDVNPSWTALSTWVCGPQTGPAVAVDCGLARIWSYATLNSGICDQRDSRTLCEMADFRTGMYPDAAAQLACCAGSIRYLMNCQAASLRSSDDLLTMYRPAPPTKTPPVATGPGIGPTPSFTSGYPPNSPTTVPRAAEVSSVIGAMRFAMAKRLS